MKYACPVSLVVWLLTGLAGAAASPDASGGAQTNAVVLYSTGFEPSEGFDPHRELMGQKGWVGTGTGGNGLIDGYFEGLGNQAFIGYAPPTDTNSALNLWYPRANLKAQSSRIRFTVEMAIMDSTNGCYDDFRWSLYNTNEDRLFSLDFDNRSLTISVGSDDQSGFVSTGRQYTNAIQYSLTIDMDFKSNLWSASLSGTTLVANQPISKAGHALNFGDMDAVWVLQEPGYPGNNYLLFDNYTVSVPPVETPPATPPRFLWVQCLSPRQTVLRLQGAANRRCLVEVSETLLTWQPLTTGTLNANGSFDLVDESPNLPAKRFYRASYAP